MSELQKRHVDAARLCAQAAETLHEAAELLGEDYDDRKQQALIEALSEASQAAVDWLVP